MLFSIIIPVYNVEKYLHQCVDSILCQKFTDYEVILVDDGSTDNCPKICDKYCSIYSNVRVIHKANAGQSSARNVGIRVAKGEYLIFVDSDDYWKDDDALTKLQQECERIHPEYLGFNCCNLNEVNGNFIYENSGIDGNKIRLLPADKVIKYFVDISHFPGAAWVCAVSKKFVLHNRLFFTEGISSEDVDWLMNVFTHAKTYDFADLYFYVYRLNRIGSVTNSIDIKAIRDMLYIIEKWTNELRTGKYSKIENYLYDYMAYHYLCTLIMANNLDKKNKAIIKKEIEKYKWLARKGIRKKVKIAGFCYCIFGFEIGSKLLVAYHTIHKG